jgi:hypothetical protein
MKHHDNEKIKNKIKKNDTRMIILLR